MTVYVATGATLTAVPTPTQGMVASLKGFAQYANAGSALPQGATAKTFECWGKTNGDPGTADRYFFIHGPDSVAGDSFGLLHNGNVADAPNLAVNFGGAVTPFTQDLEWNDTNWHHYVMTYDGSVSVVLYVDGVASQTLTLGQAQNVASAQALTIGNYGGHLLGTAFVDEMAVYSGVLSSARVLAHYGARWGGGYSAAVVADSPIVYYRFNDAGPGTTMADSSGNARNGTYSATFTPNSAALNFVYGVPDGAVV